MIQFYFAALIAVLAPAVAPLHAFQLERLGPIRIIVSEGMTEGRPPRMALYLNTTVDIVCPNHLLVTTLRRRGDTLSVEVRGLLHPRRQRGDNPVISTCETGPAYGEVPLRLSPGSYVLAVRVGSATDHLQLDISATRLQLLTNGLRTAVTRPDTTPFWRPPARSFAVHCGANRRPEACADLVAWVERQPGVRRLPIPAGWQPPSRFNEHSDHRGSPYFSYASGALLPRLRSCMREVERQVEEAVGVSIIIHIAAGEIIRASSRRAFHEPHIETPSRIAVGRGC